MSRCARSESSPALVSEGSAPLRVDLRRRAGNRSTRTRGSRPCLTLPSGAAYSVFPDRAACRSSSWRCARSTERIDQALELATRRPAQPAATDDHRGAVRATVHEVQALRGCFHAGPLIRSVRRRIVPQPGLPQTTRLGFWARSRLPRRLAGSSNASRLRWPTPGRRRASSGAGEAAQRRAAASAVRHQQLGGSSRSAAR
jgi:hypothetical protein